jgi:hypothetical protein
MGILQWLKDITDLNGPEMETETVWLNLVIPERHKPATPEPEPPPVVPDSVPSDSSDKIFYFFEHGSWYGLKPPYNGDVYTIHEPFRLGDSAVKCKDRQEAEDKALEALQKYYSHPIYAQDKENYLLQQKKQNIRAYNNRHAHDSQGRKIYVDWSPGWPAYQRKYKCLYMIARYNRAHDMGITADLLAMNTGLSLNSVKSALVKWTKGKYVQNDRQRNGYTLGEVAAGVKDRKITYWLGPRGRHLLRVLNKFQPEWVEARRKELAAWQRIAAKEWGQLDKIDLHSTHIILKKFNLN